MKAWYRLARQLLVAVLYGVRTLPGRLWQVSRGRVGLPGLGLTAVVLMVWLLAASLPAQAIATTTATRVYGQSSNGVSAITLYSPFGVAVDPTGGVYIADTYNSRALHYSGANTTADRVYGQGGSFTSATGNNGGISATSLFRPNGIVVDPTGGIYIADAANNRVLHYSGISTTADRVYGQGGSFTSATAEVSATNLYYCNGVAIDPTGGIYIADTANNRVLHYSGISTTADRVYGQGGNFTSNTENNGGISATSLFRPNGIVVDPTGGIYIADTGNNRVLHYSGVSTTANQVYGQSGSFTSATGNNGGISATSLYSPIAVAIDPTGGIYIADAANNRVLHYNGVSTTANQVYGQGGSFTSGAPNNGGSSATSLYYPAGLVVDSNGGLYVADGFNNRVLYYALSVPTLINTTAGSGQATNVASAFGTKLVAKVVDASNNPVSSAVVTFTAPSSGASGTFAGGSPVYTGTTDASGQVTATTFTANTLVGSYNVRATVSGVLTPAIFALTNTAGQLTINNVTLNEGNSGTTSFQFTVSLSFATSQTVTVQYATADNTATVADNDYQPITGTLTIPPNQITGTITVQVNGDTKVERDESFALNLTNPTGAILGNPATGIGTILNDDNGGGGCNPLLVTSTGDDGSCGTLRAALSFASANSAKTVNIQLSAGSVISLTTGLTLTTGVAITTTLPCGIGPNNTLIPPVTIQGVGSGSGVGLTLAGHNSLYGLWVRGFSGVQIKAPPGSTTKMQCVRASKL